MRSLERRIFLSNLFEKPRGMIELNVSHKLPTIVPVSNRPRAGNFTIALAFVVRGKKGPRECTKLRSFRYFESSQSEGIDVIAVVDLYVSPAVSGERGTRGNKECLRGYRFSTETIL